MSTTWKKEMGFQRVKMFLSSIQRNSLKSRYAYQYGLVHFQRFLFNKYQDYNLETILTPLKEDKINPYDMLDNFISYLQTGNPTLTASCIQLYMASIRSYLAYHDVDIIPSKLRER
ncbi:MAG: hypothetical protein DLM72_17200 [Candidatus Nitrosopolaris wilkensis]|nr:MAG: hypothetical protein DLM72_17200 [Candidatus Nitrosopolaris wilkensis]